jgi:hypothetical protein
VRPDWGDIPTAGATLFAAAAFVVAWRTNRRERGEQARAERQAQAVKVAAWLVPDNLSTLDDSDTIGLAIRNASDLPVFHVRIDIYRYVYAGDEDGEEGGSIFETLDYPLVLRLPQLGPASEPLFVAWPLPAGTHRHSSLDDGGVSPWSDLYLTFRDASGVAWTRSPDGALREGYRTLMGRGDLPFGVWEDFRWRYGLPERPAPTEEAAGD